jgi:hypothetical protein
MHHQLIVHGSFRLPAAEYLAGLMRPNYSSESANPY